MEMKKLAALMAAVIFSIVLTVPCLADGTNPKPPDSRIPAEILFEAGN
jgi:hypothetical protein